MDYLLIHLYSHAAGWTATCAATSDGFGRAAPTIVVCRYFSPSLQLLHLSHLCSATRGCATHNAFLTGCAWASGHIDQGGGGPRANEGGAATHIRRTANAASGSALASTKDHLELTWSCGHQSDHHLGRGLLHRQGPGRRSALLP